MHTGWMLTAVAGSVVTGIVRNRLRIRSRGLGGSARFRAQDARLFPEPSQRDDGDESLDVWGFSDTRFVLAQGGVVELSGKRYALSGKKLLALVPWVRDVMGIEITPDNVNRPNYPPQIPEPVQNDAFLAELEEVVRSSQFTAESEARLRHGHGHTQEEMYAIKHGHIARVPDLVVFPEEENEVVDLVALAAKHNVCLIPYGGGTSVTEALKCPPGEERMIVSVDMKRMNRVLWIDPVNRMACIEAGAVGRHIMKALEDRGYTMGHEPDSVEFSTLGGWIATHASGMKKNKYGNIEDLVLDMNVVTADGLLKRSGLSPRESVGTDPRRAMFGSEGNLGIITQAVVKLFPLPEAQTYGSVIFPSFEEGVAFMYDLAQAGNPPASVRLVDNTQFQFSLALKPASQGAKVLKSKLEKLYVTKLRGFEPQRMCACTLVFEGTREQVRQQEDAVYGTAARHGGLKGGSENGKRGYALTYSIAYIRDFVMNYYMLAESFETSVPWNRVLELCERVKRRLLEEHAARNLPGRPFITARVTQVYSTGAAVYFYFGFYYKGVENPAHVYSEIEAAARDEILRAGGSLSHHHGVGKLRQQFMPQIMSPAAIAWNKQAKQAVDPQNVFGCGNQPS